YACTFGVGDFKKLDRYIKVKVGKWRKVDLLTEKDKAVMAKLKDPRAIARKNRMWSYVHTAIFIMANIVFWQLYGNDAHAFLHYVKDWSWYEDVGIEHAPYTNEMVMNAVKLWIIIYAVDTVVAWSYTLFPAEEKGEQLLMIRKPIPVGEAIEKVISHTARLGTESVSLDDAYGRV